jgi:hypothetical protein
LRRIVGVESAGTSAAITTTMFAPAPTDPD